MTTDELIELGNRFREQRQPGRSLECYAQAFVQDPDSAAAWNNYGNVMREMGHPDRAVPFLEHCLRLAPNHDTASFNLAVCFLLMGDYQRGWAQYESRWNFEHLRGTLPQFVQPRWTGQPLRDRTILVVGEQGLGDNIQFSRYVMLLKEQGARIRLTVPAGLVTMFGNNDIIDATVAWGQDLGEFDMWCPIMSLPGVLGQALPGLYSPLHYIMAQPQGVAMWRQRLGIKNRLRAGISWSGRRDTWINQHKAVGFEHICGLIAARPEVQWINLQVDATQSETETLASLGVTMFPGSIQTMSDTAALIDNLDVVISVDSAVSHLAAAMARPTWVMLNQYGVDWRWLLNRDDSPWYPTVRLFRQPVMDDWATVMQRVSRHLALFKI